MSRGRSNGMSPFRAGVLALVIVALFAYFGFSKNNPFANPYEFKAVFNDVNNLKPKSPVRIAGVEVGKVTKVEPVDEGQGAAQVTMEIQDKGLPIKKDAELKIRPRIFLEGNFFVDLEPGSPSAPRARQGRRDPGDPDRGAGPVRRPPDRAPARHAHRPPDLPARVLEGARGRRRRGLQRGGQVLGARLPQQLARQRRHARPGPEPRPPARPQGPAEDLRGARQGRGRAEGPGHELQRDRGRVRARGRGARRSRCPPCATRSGSATRRSARSTPRCRRCARSRTTRSRACAPPTRRSPPRCRSSTRRAS